MNILHGREARVITPVQMTCHFWVIIIFLQWVNGLLIVLQSESTMALCWKLQGENRGQEMGCIMPYVVPQCYRNICGLTTCCTI